MHITLVLVTDSRRSKLSLQPESQQEDEWKVDFGIQVGCRLSRPSRCSSKTINYHTCNRRQQTAARNNDQALLCRKKRARIFTRVNGRC